MTPRWTVLELLQEAVRYLSQKEIPTPRLDGEVLLAYALGCQRIDLYLRHDQPLTEEEIGRFRELIRRRCQREPVAYITGVKEFWSLPLQITQQVLIPRPETEALVEAALDVSRSGAISRGGPYKILEIGTGSGAVAIALAVEVGERVKIIATDRSSEALEVARTNAQAIGVDGRILYIEGDLFDPLEPTSGPFALIVSNPPYVPTHEIPRLPPDIRNYEPREALDGGTDGLAVIRRILREAPPWLEQGGHLLVEVGEGQRTLIEMSLRQDPMWSTWSWVKDLQGNDRVLCAQKNAEPSSRLPHEGENHG